LGITDLGQNSNLNRCEFLTLVSGNGTPYNKEIQTPLCPKPIRP
jgi:hypothetical protein